MTLAPWLTGVAGGILPEEMVSNTFALLMLRLAFGGALTTSVGMWGVGRA